MVYIKAQFYSPEALFIFLIRFLDVAVRQTHYRLLALKIKKNH